MLSISCSQCRRRFTMGDEEIRGYLVANAGKRHAQVICPHCGRGNKVAPQRLEKAIRFATPAADQVPSVEPDEAPAE